jgi:cbb3-type cytochrome oxidase subunit 3
MTEVLGSSTEIFFTSLLVICSIAIVWFAFYVLYRLFKSE